VLVIQISKQQRECKTIIYQSASAQRVQTLPFPFQIKQYEHQMCVQLQQIVISVSV